MKRGYFITIFVTAHLLFIFLHIYKYNLNIKQSYAQQKQELHYEQLVHKKQRLTQELYALQNKTAIKQYAAKKLGLRPLKLSQIKRLRNVTA